MKNKFHYFGKNIKSDFFLNRGPQEDSKKHNHEEKQQQKNPVCTLFIAPQILNEHL